MLFVFFGTDTVRVRTHAHAEVLRQGGEGGEVVSVTPENFSLEYLRDIAGAQSLFGTGPVVLIDMLSLGSDMLEALLLEAPRLGESPRTFVLIEGALTEKEKKALSPYAEKMSESKGGAAERFNTFALSDAFLRRDKKTLWILLTDAWRSGVTNEEIIGTLLWQLKMLRLAASTNSAEEAGQKSYTYDKAKRALLKFKEGEIRAYAHALVMLYHDGHTGKRDLTLGLEAWVLKM